MHAVAPSKSHHQAVPCDLHRVMLGTAQQHVLIGVATAVITAPQPAKCLSAVTNPSLGCCSVELQVLLHALWSCCATSSCSLDSMAAAATAQLLLLQLLLYDRNRAQMLCSVQQRTTSTQACADEQRMTCRVLPLERKRTHTHNNVTTLTSMHETLHLAQATPACIPWLRLRPSLTPTLRAGLAFSAGGCGDCCCKGGCCCAEAVIASCCRCDCDCCCCCRGSMGGDLLGVSCCLPWL